MLHEAHTSSRTAALAVAVPVAVTLLVVGGPQVRLAAGPAVLARCGVAAVLVLLAALVPPLGLSVLLMGVVAVVLVVAEIAAPQAGDWSAAAAGSNQR